MAQRSQRKQTDRLVTYDPIKGVMMKLKDKIALVTGSANGIGRATAIKLAQEGAHVVVNDLLSQEDRARQVFEEIKGMGRESMVLFADVSKTDEVNRMAASLLDKFGRLDILVNNAGFARPVRVVDMTDEDWDIVINTCLRGTFLCSRAFMKPMMAQKSGKILNLASNSIWSIWPGFAQYAAAKAGIVTFTKVLALELAEYRINVNAIAPGFTGTENALVRSGPAHVERMEKGIPMGRIGTTDDLMGAVMLLVSGDGDFITGETILIAGGYTFR
jgi:3-oxoacyl-[acyl-carrier protein] reductase